MFINTGSNFGHMFFSKNSIISFDNHWKDFTFVILLTKVYLLLIWCHFQNANDPSSGPMCFGIYENQEVNNNENVEVVEDNILEMKIGFWLNAENEVIDSSMTF
jgi:hypothetical protein